MTGSKTILVVEDDALIALGLAQILDDLGYNVKQTVATGEDAVRLANEIHPDLILMDIQLATRMTGIDAAHLIHEDLDIPIVYLTAYSDDTRLQMAKSTGPYGYLVKPVQSQELRTTIEVALYKHELDMRLRDSEERYRAVIMQAMEGIVLFDQESRTIIEANPAFENLFGYSLEELSGKKIYDLIDRTPEEVDGIFSRVIGNGQLQLGEQKFRHKDASLLDVECNSSVIRRGGKKIIVCVVAHDVTERKKAENALREANRKLQLLSSITRHDIQNKMTVLLGYMGQVKKHTSDPRVTAFIVKQETAAHAIAAQIAFTRQYQEIGVRNPVWQSLKGVVKKAELDTDMGDIPLIVEDASLWIYADPLLEKVFFNLIDNSLAHGGRVTEIRITTQPDSGGMNVLYSDNGVGISQEFKEHIFERGFGENTGLGLFLIREILAITGITIQETGEKEKGVCFKLHLPNGTHQQRA